jgi:hypothetical protein
MTCDEAGASRRSLYRRGSIWLSAGMRFLPAMPLAVVAAFAATAAAAPAMPEGVVPCHVWAKYPNTLISSARNMTCKAAAQEMRNYRGQISRTFNTPGRFRCSRVSGGQFGGQWRCVRGTRAFRFEFGD